MQVPTGSRNRLAGGGDRGSNWGTTTFHGTRTIFNDQQQPAHEESPAACESANSSGCMWVRVRGEACWRGYATAWAA